MEIKVLRTSYMFCYNICGHRQCVRMRRESSTLPTRFGNGSAPSISSPRLVYRWQFQAVKSPSPSGDWSPQANSDEDCTEVAAAPLPNRVSLIEQIWSEVADVTAEFPDAGNGAGDAQLRDRSSYSLAQTQADCHSKRVYRYACTLTGMRYLHSQRISGLVWKPSASNPPEI